MSARLSTCDVYDVALPVLLAALTVLAFATAGSYGISNDEPVQQRYGELIVDYYRSGFADQALFHLDNLYLYGGLFDIAAVLTERLFPWIDPYTIRHLLSALTGIAGIAAAGATARLVAGPRAGLIAALALAACGPWYGSMFNHTKDIPFAAAMMGATYFLLRAARGLPSPQRRDVIGFGLLIGAALGIRVLGMLMIGYAGIAMIIHTAQLRAGQEPGRLSFFARSALALAPAFLIGYLIMIAAWPWSALSPLNPIRGLIDFGHFKYQIHTLLNGQVYAMGDVPRWYVPAYLLIKLPLLMLTGALVTLGLIVRSGPARHEIDKRLEILLLVFIPAFPVACQVIEGGPAFTGLRHFLFVVPPLAVIAGIGFDAALAKLEERGRLVAVTAAATIAAALTWDTATLVRLHPHQYLYYNPLVGGFEGAAGRYDTDYWVNMMPEALTELEMYVARLERADPGRNYTVAVCGERLAFESKAGSRLRWSGDWSKADFFIAPTHMNCDRALDGAVISTIARLGTPIGVVKDRRALTRGDMARRR